ncbi:MAG TPA: enolase C-terminal domain-like protein [Lacipirellulaceae bacterium]
MKISHIETIPVRVPIKPDFAIRSGRGGAHLVSPFLIVKVYTDGGIVGLGEASCTPRWSGEDQVTAAHFINAYFAPLLVGEAVDDVERLRAKFSSTVAGNFFTKAAVEMALWDIAGKTQGKPVFELLGDSSRHTPCAVADAADGTRSVPATLVVPTKWSISGVEPAKATEIAVWAANQGFQAMKVKVGIEPQSDLERTRAVREAVGAQVKLGVDANGGWPTPRVAIEMINRLFDECGIYFAEQPVAAGNESALAEVRRNVSVPIIADESIWSLEDAKTLARADAADVFSIYIGKAGGIGPAREIARFAHSVGIQCTVGSNLELGVGSAAMIHLALSAPAIDTCSCDIIGPLFYEDDLLNDPLPISGGVARLPDGPGLGVELDDEKVEKYRVR